MSLAFKLYSSFLIGVILASLFLSFILARSFISKEFLKQKSIYLDGKFYKLCEQRVKCSN